MQQLQIFSQNEHNKALSRVKVNAVGHKTCSPRNGRVHTELSGIVNMRASLFPTSLRERGGFGRVAPW